MQITQNQIESGLEPFEIKTRKGFCTGVYSKEKNKIFVHLIEGRHCIKGLMQILINKFKTNLITFTPLITNNIPLKVRGTIKTISATDVNNPYGEDIKIMECIWT